MKFILLVILFNGSNAVMNSTEFDSKESCFAAYQLLESGIPEGTKLVGGCVEK
jgi:hypothetical protein